MHPAYKTAYFRKQLWEPEWIVEAIDIVKSEWAANYQPQVLDPLPAPESSTSLNEKYFGSLHGHLVSYDELDVYLDSPAIVTIKNPLEYWSAMDPDSNPLARMAIDFLSVPGMLFLLFPLSYSQLQKLHLQMLKGLFRGVVLTYPV